MLQEEWRGIAGHSLYEVSNRGNVRRSDTHKPLKPDVVSGYNRVRLTESGVVTRCLIHRLVAAAFHGDPPDGYVANHKNGNKQDNRPENLEWVSRAENSHHAYHSLNALPHLAPKGERNHMAKLTDAQVIEIRAALANGKRVTALARDYGVSHSLISMIRSGKVRCIEGV